MPRRGVRGEGVLGQTCTLGQDQNSAVKGAGGVQKPLLAPALPCQQAQQSLVAEQAC